MITRSQLEGGIARYIDREVLPRLPQSGIQKVVIGAFAAMLSKRIGVMVDELSKNKFAGMLGIVNSDGLIDIDLLRDSLKQSMGDEPLIIEIPLVGEMIFRSGDIDVIHSYAVR